MSNSGLIRGCKPSALLKPGGFLQAGCHCQHPTNSVEVLQGGWLEFDVPFQQKYGYICAESADKHYWELTAPTLTRKITHHHHHQRIYAASLQKEHTCITFIHSFLILRMTPELRTSHPLCWQSDESTVNQVLNQYKFSSLLTGC